MPELYSVAIDGPSGAGKSTLAKAAAAALGICYVDTGAIYRTIGYGVYCRGIDPSDAAAVAASADPTYAAMFVQDGVFWHLLAYCAGVGGSLLIIGSAAGVVAMGLENINFVWYFKKISLMAFVGYLAGIGVCMLEVFLFGI